MGFILSLARVLAVNFHRQGKRNSQLDSGPPPVLSQVVTMNGGTHGYLAGGDNVVPFDFPFSTLTNAFDISPSGDVIVGGYIDATKAVHGFLMRMGDATGTVGVTGPFEFATIDYPGSTRSVARGINARGDIVGYYNDAAGKTHGFFMSPGRGRRD